MRIDRRSGLPRGTLSACAPDVAALWRQRNAEPEPMPALVSPNDIADADDHLQIDLDCRNLVAGLRDRCWTEREYDVLRLHYCEEYTLDEICSVLGVTRERARQIEAKAIRKARTQLRIPCTMFDTLLEPQMDSHQALCRARLLWGARAWVDSDAPPRDSIHGTYVVGVIGRGREIYGRGRTWREAFNNAIASHPALDRQQPTRKV